MWFSTLLAFLCIMYGIQRGHAANTVLLKSNAVTSTLNGIRVYDQKDIVRNDQQGTAGSRTRRSLFPSDMKQKLLDKHNNLRRLEYSSDMEILSWSDYLAGMAEDWALGCVWEHGQPYRDPEDLPFSSVGQNLLVYNGTFDPVNWIQLFYDEVDYYDYDTGACRKEPCGHYTQLVWSTSRTVGCAYAFCPQMYKIDIINAHYLVCNYGPGGNYVDQKPYKKGPACTACESRQFWCDNGLCRRDCTRQNTKCECKANCKNCAAVVQSNCSCSCTAGWHGDDCSVTCEDTHHYCGANPGWPLSWCNVSYVREGCPAMCSVCTVGDVECVTQPTIDISKTGGATSPITSYINLLAMCIIHISMLYYLRT